MSQIFISYSRKDLAVAEKIIDALLAENLEPWVDWKRIPKGEEFWPQIKLGIEGSDIFLFLISPDSAQSDWCNKEIEHAVENRKRILPIVVRDVDPKTTHPEITKRNWTFCRDGQDDFPIAIEETFNAIKTDYEWLSFHTKLQVNALDWERQQDDGQLLRGNLLTNAEQKLAGIDSRKDPQPTDIQRHYISSSRKVENQEKERLAKERAVTRKRLRNLGIAIGIVLLIAAIASTLAITLRGQVEVERTDKEKAKDIALANQLISQAQPMFADGNPKQMIAVLLAIQSMRLNPSGEAAYILQNHTLIKPATQITYDGARHIAFSPDGKYIVASSMYSTVAVWEISSGISLTQVEHYGDNVQSIFDPNGRYIISGTDRIVKVLEVETGAEVTHLDIKGLVIDFSFSQDGRYVVVGDYNNFVSVWELGTGKEIAHIPHDDIRSVDISPNGKYIVFVGRDNIVKLWEVDSGKELTELSYEDNVYLTAFSPDSRLLASSYSVPGKRQSIIAVWDINTGKNLSAFVHEENINSISFSADNEFLISGSDDNTARIWEIATGMEISLITHGDEVNTVALSPNGLYAASGSKDFTARVWEVQTGREIARMTHAGAVSSVVFSPDGNYLASASADGDTLIIGDFLSNKKLVQIQKEKDVEIAFSPDNKLLVLGDVLGNIYVLDATTGLELAMLSPREHDGSVQFIRFSPDSRYLLTSSGAGVIHIWDSVTGKEISVMKHDDRVLDAVFSPDGQFVLSGSEDRTARIWNVNSGQEVFKKSNEDFVYSVGFSPDGNYIVTGGNAACVWNTSTGDEIACKHHGVNSRIEFVSFMPSNGNVLSFDGLGNIYIWNALTGETISTMKHDEYTYVTSVDFTRDGKYVVSGGSDATARVWDASTGREVSRMTHERLVNSVVFSNNGQYVVSASQDGTMRVWESMTGKEVSREAHDGYIHFVSFKHDDSLIYSGGCLQSEIGTCLHGGVSVWWYRSEDLINNACSYVTRNLSNEEWEQYIGNALPYQEICPNLPIGSDSIPTP